MLKGVVTAVLAFLFFASLLGARQEKGQDPAEVKRRILEKVRERLAAERAQILKRVEKIIDEELAKEAPAAEPSLTDAERKLREAERNLRLLEEQRENQAEEVARLKRAASDEPLRKEAAQEGLVDPQEMQALFDEALKLHEADKYVEAVPRFKKLYYRLPGSSFGATSAYNAACGLALQGNKEEALDWLETAVRGGFDKIEHLRNDPDLDGLRDEKRYKKLLTDR